MCSNTTQRTNNPGFYQLDLCLEILFAAADLTLLWVAVVRWAALDDVGDVHVVACHIDGFEPLVCPVEDLKLGSCA